MIGTDVPLALAVCALLAWLGVLVVQRVARGDTCRALKKIMIASLALHLLCSSLQIFVVNHYYHGVADWVRYDNQGAALADMWRAGHFALAGSGVTGIVGNGSVSIASGLVMFVVGPNQLAAFFVSSWLAFVGAAFFYLAFRITFPRADRRRYAALVFLFPSLLFWTADVSKEAFMSFSLGLTAYGMALVLTGRRVGYWYVLAGGAFSLFIRPNEVVLLAIGFALAMAVRALWGKAAGGFRRPRHPFTTVGAFVFVGAIVVISTVEAVHFIHGLSGSGLTNSLNTLAGNNHGTGAGFGSSTVTYSSNPLWYPRDVYTVLFDPLPFSAHGVTQLIAAAENTLLLLLVLVSLPRLRHLPRVCRQRPYVLAALFYSAVFLFAFAALGNLGLITRERTLLLPLLFVVLAFPVAHRGATPYPWQRKHRRQLRPPVLLGPSGDVEPVVAREPAYVAATGAASATWDADGGATVASGWTTDRWDPSP